MLKDIHFEMFQRWNKSLFLLDLMWISHGQFTWLVSTWTWTFERIETPKGHDWNAWKKQCIKEH